MTCLLFQAIVLAISVFVIDGQESSNVPVIVDYSVINGKDYPEDIAVGQVLGKVEAFDPDGTDVTFTLGDDGAQYLGINSTTGEVKLVGRLDFEKDQNLEIPVTLIVRDEDFQESIRYGSILVTDVNDELPIFKFQALSASLPEDSPTNLRVHDIVVTDIDTENSKLVVKCVPRTKLQRDACNTFQLRMETRSTLDWNGYLLLRKTLNYEDRKAYVIPLEAFDGVNYATDEIHIEVNDTNDVPPRWDVPGPQYIDEELPPGTFLTSVNAFDPDTRNRRNIFYELMTHEDVFRIDGRSGDVFIEKQLDYDTGTRKNTPYLVTIKAREIIDERTNTYGDDPLTTATITMEITVSDINDNAPLFLDENNRNKTNYVAYINENIQSGRNVPGLRMTVTDRDASEEYNTFRLDTTTYRDIFGIVPNDDTASTSPRLFVRDGQKIDYESGDREYIVEITAIEKTQPAFSSTATVTIYVLDVNDQVPQFERPNYTVSVSELARGGTPLELLIATDSEEGMFGTNGIRYELLGDNPGHFRIDRLTGQLTVEDCATPGVTPCIDYEIKKEYRLTVQATDDDGRGQTKSAEVFVTVLDENDNVPKINATYLRYIYEEKTVTVNPLVITAVDPDIKGKNLTYSISGDASNLWQITTGYDPVRQQTFANITAKRPIKMEDAPDKVNGQFLFDVVVFDKKSSSTARVTIKIIDTNNNSPYFLSPSYRANIPENVEGDVVVQKVYCQDRDSHLNGNGVVDIAYASGGGGSFVMKNPGNETDGDRLRFFAELYTGIGSNFESGPSSYNLTLLCRDRGSPARTGTASIIINVQDTNNEDPFITPTSTTITVREDTGIGMSVHRINAFDPDSDSRLIYFLEPKSAIKPNGEPATVDWRSMFRVESSTGDVIVNAALNRDDVSFFTNDIFVRDVNADPVQTGTGALFIRITEYNDQDPVFSSQLYNVSVDEERTRNTFVTYIECFDEDDRISDYSIFQQTPRYPEFFSLLPNTGTIIINNRIDFEQIEMITLAAECVDTGQPARTATSSIVVYVNNMNDNTPIFSKNSYSVQISEGTIQSEQFLLQVNATDIDKGDYGVVRYRVDDSRFRIEPVTGEIYIVAGSEFDREEYNSMGLQVIAYDSPNNPGVRRQSSVPVYIRIADINDNCPQFTQKTYTGVVPESADPNTNILDILASDRDIGDNGRMFFSIVQGSGDPPGAELLFKVISREDDARLLTAQSLRDKVGLKRFNVTATDRGPNPCTTTAVVEVQVRESQNDAPEFVRPPRRDWVIYVLESQYNGMLIYSAKARDPDQGPNGVVDYFFSTRKGFESNTTEFRINRVTGVIRSEIVFDREMVDTYFLTLMARDQGNPAASSETTITIIILDVDDNDPRFPMKNGVVTPLILPESGVIVEGTAPPPGGRKLGNCSYLATDADSDHRNNKIYYRLLTTNDVISQHIKVDRETCEIYLMKEVDYEMLNSLEFDILAYNEKNDDTVKRYKRPKREVNPSILPVIVRITDDNDNPPVFSQQTYLACASVDAKYRETILEVVANDPDVGDNSNIIYSLETGGNNFYIDPSLGIIQNKISFRYDGGAQRKYLIDIKASDRSDDTGKTGRAKAVVFITDGSNLVKLKVNRPRFEVEPFKQQLISTIKANSNGKIAFACIDSINNHETEEGEESTAEADVLLLAARDNNGVYTIIPASELSRDIEAMLADDDNKLSAIYVTRVQVKGESDEFELTEDAVLAIFIICLLLIFLLIILLLLACYCIRNSKKKKVRKLKANRHTIVQVANQPVETSFNPVYSSGPDNPEYTTVQKAREAQQPPITPVVIPAPDDLQPMPSEEPSNLVPVQPEPSFQPEEPVIETEVLPDPVPGQGPRQFEHPEYEDRIETVVQDEPVIVAALEDPPNEEPPMPPPPNDGEIEVEIRENPPSSPGSSRKGSK